MPQVLNARDTGTGRRSTATAVYVGRPSKWGNPFLIGRDGDRAEVIQSFRAYIDNRPDLVQAAQRELRGKDLVCWCSPLPCHADVLLEIANSNRTRPHNYYW